MSKALRCDRCNKCFDPWVEERDFTRIHSFSVQNGTNYRNNERNYYEEDVDLCPECTKLFSAFMRKVQAIVIEIKLENDIWNVYEDGKLVSSFDDLMSAAREVDKIKSKWTKGEERE